MRASNGSMHSHDLDLIAALAEGSLEDETDARHLVETCVECREEFAAQSAVLATLRNTPGVAMTEVEKAALHRDLWTELRAGSTAPSTAKIPWWYRLGFAAAGVLIIVGVGAVAGQLRSGQIEASFNEAGSALGEAAPRTTEPAGGAAEAPQFGDGAEEDSAFGAADSMDFAAVAEEFRSKGTLNTLSAEQDPSVLDELQSCVDRAGPDRLEAVGRIGGYIVAVSPDTKVDAGTEITFVDATSCEIGHVER